MSKFLVAVFLSFSFSTIFAQIDHSEVVFVRSELKKNNVVVDELFITDHYSSQGITHTYYKEAINRIPIYNSRGAIHYKDKHRVIVKHRFKRRPKAAVVSPKPLLSAREALDKLAIIKGLNRSGEIKVIEPPKGATQQQILEASFISLRSIPARLEYYYVNETDLRLIWQLPIERPIDAWYTNYIVDANSGELLAEIDWTIECNHGPNENSAHKTCDHDLKKIHKKTETSLPLPNSYEVFAWPVESPHFGDRTMEVSPWLDNATASPNGWHTIGSDSYTTTRGNNTDTYIDDDNTNFPTGGDAARADGGAMLDFSFPLDTALPPPDFKDAAVTNTFYWTNLMHDVWYNYGFDEASGNFQEENYTANGLGSDYVRSEAQDGMGTCNANFGTPPDGVNPRMQMYLCTQNGNFRDGDYDNGVIAHEYGHGISNRLTGGPAAAGCLSNAEQMGEGWSDYFGLVMTIETGDSGTDSRGIGTWLFGQGPDGAGIRPYPYSTDFGVNPMTYNNINTLSVPHGVGSVWCTMLWDMTWALIDEYGFDPDIYNGTGGNNLAMQLVMEGMKLQPCSPGFVDGRDAILEADELLNGGVNSCLIWNVFANRGLGYSANQESPGSSLDGIEAFDLAPICALSVEKSTAISTAEEEDQIVYQIIVKNNLDTALMDIVLTDTIPDELIFDSASGGGTASGGIISFPLFDLDPSESDTFEVILEVKLGISSPLSDIYDDIESGTGNWATTSEGSTSWTTQTSVSNSATTAWFAPDNNTSGTAYLDLAFEVGLDDGSELSFFHQYDTESEWDGGQVFISTNSGRKWTDLGPKMILNGYNNTIFNSIPGFSGNSNGFLNTIIDLDAYSGTRVIIRFQMNCDQFFGGNGWWIDDIALTNLKLLTVNEAAVSSAEYFATIYSNPVEILPPSTLLKATVNKNNITCSGESDGDITVNVQGGTGSYTFNWNDGTTTQNRTNLNEGVYRVTISDGVDQLVKVASIIDPLELNISFEVDEISNIAGDNGSIEVISSGGTGALSYIWNTGAMTSEISDLQEGIYTVTVTDENSCEAIDSVELIKYDCGETYYDSGGSSSNYANNEDRVVTICPDSIDEGVVLTFNMIEIESNYDALYIHNGNSTSGLLFDSGNGPTLAGFPPGGYYGTTEPGPFTATNESGCITLRFLSDGGLTLPGWDIDITCTPCAGAVFTTDAEGYGSLKKEIECADPVDVITFAEDVYLDTITLDATLLIEKQLTLDPAIGNAVSIMSNQQGPIFTIGALGSLDLNFIKLISGEMDPGGAIINNGTLILKNVDVIGNANTPNPEGLILNNGQMNVQGGANIIKD